MRGPIPAASCAGMRGLARQGRPVRWRRHISDAELTEAYRTCAFTVFPSRLEGFGLPIIESLLARAPGHLRRKRRHRRSSELAAVVSWSTRTIQCRAGHSPRLPSPRRNALPASGTRRLEARTFRSWDDYGSDLDQRAGAWPPEPRAMLYLDVTGGCTLPLQTGIPRTTRELYRLACARLPDVVPIRWQPFRGPPIRASAPTPAAVLAEPRCPTPRRRVTPLGRSCSPLFAIFLPGPRAVPLHLALRPKPIS